MSSEVADRAIHDSVRQNRIVHLDAADLTADDLDALEALSEDGASNGIVREFWGTTDAGHGWRVHVYGEAA